MALENVLYEEIKAKMLQKLGQSVTDYAKLNEDKLTYKKIEEFFLDDFFDLEMQE